ncbi:MAG TPA: DNA-binding protein [Lactobacillaceae bacterium]|jgi:hypothetical protein
MLINFLAVTLVFSLGWLAVQLLALLWHKKWRWTLWSSVVAFIALTIFLYGAMPSKNLSTLLQVNLAGAVIAAVLNALVYGGVRASDFFTETITGRHGKREVNLAKPAYFKQMLALIGGLILALIILAGAQFVTRLTSINNVYDSIPVKTAKSATPLTSTKDMPIALAPETAKRKMQQKFSVIPNSNMYHLDGITAQVVNGKYVYVATVEFNGFFRWLKNREVPGYFIISATDVNAQPQFIQTPIRYAPSAYLNDDAARRIYAAFPTYTGTGAINLEISDNGTPYYVQTLYREYGVSGRMRFDQFKTAVLNAQTGVVKLYDADKAPKFVDAPITASAANAMNEFYGRYGRGWWNQTSFGAKRDVKVPTENGIYAQGKITPLMDEKGNLMYFTDFTSGNSDQDSALGYSLINAKTGAITYYRDNGAGLMDSDGAISIADKIYPEKKWEAKMPILYNIDGTPTWVISLLDSKGIFKKYVYINAIDNDVVIDGNRSQDTLDDYRARLAQNEADSNSDAGKTQMLSGKVTRVVLTSEDNDTIVNFMLAGHAQVFKIQADQAPTAIFMQKDDNVTLQATIVDKATTVNVETLTIKTLPK